MTLDEVKQYLRVDGTDEDAVISSLMAAMALEIKRRTGKTLVAGKGEDGEPVTADISTDELYCLAVKIGVADAYENRGSEAVGRIVARYSRTFEQLVQFIAVSGNYT